MKRYLLLLLSSLLVCLGNPSHLPASEETAKNSDKQSNKPAEPPSKKSVATGTEDGVPTQKTFSSVEERRLYNTLERERSGLQEKIKVLADKEKELKTLEQEVDKKFEQLDARIKELKKVQKKTEALLEQKNQEELKKIKELSTIYAKMAPDKAALALNSLEDQQLAADLLANMKPKSAAKIMDQLDKIKASKLTQSLSTLSPPE